MFPRNFSPPSTWSFFLFGARGTGKTTLLRSALPPDRALWIDLLDPAWERRLIRSPEMLLGQVDEALRRGLEWVVVDEVQKVPALLDVAHKALFETKIRFALTGSSARKLRRGAANLLAGRALTSVLQPLSFVETGPDLSFEQALHWGSLPSAATIDDDALRTRYLNAYCEAYLKEEVFAEQLTRRLAPFRMFVELAGRDNGHVLNFDRIASDIGVDGKTVASYYQILEDTWLGFFLRPTGESLRKKQRQRPKFYLFDVGVARTLGGVLDLPLRPGTNLYGDTFEHLVILEAWRLNALTEAGYSFAYFASHDGREVDLVLEKSRRPSIFVEIKSTTAIRDRDLGNLRALRPEVPGGRFMCLSQDPVERVEDGIEILPWRVGLMRLFGAGLGEAWAERARQCR